MDNLSFLPEAWADYVHWQEQDKKTVKKINKLITDILRNGNTGLGKPEPLKENLSGWWSRRIDDANRLVYKIEANVVIISQCRTHYNAK